MNRFNPLNPFPRPPRGQELTSQRTIRRFQPATGKVASIVENLPPSVFAFMLPPDEHPALEQIRADFLKYCVAHPEFADWRHAWTAFRNAKDGSGCEQEGNGPPRFSASESVPQTILASTPAWRVRLFRHQNPSTLRFK
jgi:hypothetical protein